MLYNVFKFQDALKQTIYHVYINTYLTMTVSHTMRQQMMHSVIFAPFTTLGLVMATLTESGQTKAIASPVNSSTAIKDYEKKNSTNTEEKLKFKCVL